ncbi:MAG TPA: glycosyltransferase family 39 protein [Candidatus Acidoferrum sp.]|nr:glycosyltransferase family 39 protein [Candidatus Acidoferrum sp.]
MASGALQQNTLKNAQNTRNLAHIAMIVGLWALIYVPGLFSPPLLDDADARHAEAAREMLQRHDFVTMYVDGVRYLDKAPLPYWLNAASHAIFGYSEFAVRLPTSLAALALFLALYRLGKYLAGETAGFFAAILLATAVGPYLYTRFFIPDIMVCLWLTLSVDLFARTLDEPPPAWRCWLLGAVTALNVLTKGLIGVVFPVLIFGGYLIIAGNLKHIRKLHLISTFLVFLAIAAPWHVLATLRNPAQGEAKGFFWFYFINEQINRYLNTRVPRDYDKVPLLLFWGLIAVWLAPWTPFVTQGFWLVPRFWRISERSGWTREQRGALLLLVWALAILLFFSFSTRQEYYVLPSLPALALLTGMWLAKEDEAAKESAERRMGLRCSAILLAIGAVIFAVTIFFAMTAPPAPAGADIVDLLTSNPDLYTLSLGHLFDLTGQSMSLFRLPLALTGIAFLAGTFSNWWLRRRWNVTGANLALAGMMAVFLFAVHLALGTFYPALGSKPLAMAIQREFRPGDTIVIDGTHSQASSINFYTGQPLRMLNGRTDNLWYGSLFPDCPAVFEDDASFRKMWQGPNRVFFVVYDRKGREKLDALGAQYFEVAKSGGKNVYSNRPSPTMR